jgi:hypothetical protein
MTEPLTAGNKPMKTANMRMPGLALAAILALAAAAPTAGMAADDPAATAPGHTLYGDPAVPDISGLWLGTYTSAPGDTPQVPVEPRDITRWAPWPPPLTPAYQKEQDEIAAAAKQGRAIGNTGARCLPFGMPSMLTVGVYQNEIIQTPGAVTISAFSQLPIIVWTDGRSHPKDLKPSYNGHTIGYWDGDTLHADTVGIISTTPIGPSEPRTPHSGKLHMQWTIRRVGPDVLHMQITLYDDDAFTEPMVTTELLHRKAGAGWQQLDDISCFENNRNTADSGGAPGFDKF